MDKEKNKKDKKIRKNKDIYQSIVITKLLILIFQNFIIFL